MNMEIGSETRRAIILKYRQRLKMLLSENEVIAGDNHHMKLLVDLCQQVETDNEQFRLTANDGKDMYI